MSSGERTGFETATDLPAMGAQSDDRGETERLSAAPTMPIDSAFEMHRAIAQRLLGDNQTSRAFSELVRAARSMPMTAHLARAMSGLAVRAGTAAAAVALMQSALDDAEPRERAGIRRSLARLFRKTDDLESAREQLVMLLAESPQDRLARVVLNALLEREERWDELDASLEKETREALRRGALRSASRGALKRARMWGERVHNHARAALRYGQAAQYAAQAEDLESAFLLRLLWMRSLHQSQAPVKVLREALELSLDSGDAVGKADRVRALARELGLVPAAVTDPRPGPILSVEKPARTTDRGHPAFEPDVPRRHSTQLELMAVADEVEKLGSSHTPEMAALLAAAVQEGPDPQALKRLEAHYVARGAWRELASFYRDRATDAESRATRVDALEKLAELLESELDDAMGAARVYAELVEIGDARAVTEQVRLLNAHKDSRGVRTALDEGVQKAGEPAARAQALVLRGEHAVAQKNLPQARADFDEALKLAPHHPIAWAGLAELVGELDGTVIRRFAEVLAAQPKRRAGRVELYRRLARLADAPLRDAALSKDAWNEVLLEQPDDEEAAQRLADISRGVGDQPQLERMLRAQLLREPRSERARKNRLELISVLEEQGRKDDALEELKAAVRFEPGHKEAWLALADRFSAKLEWRLAVWALEQAAASTEDGLERMRTWLRLARLYREKMKDEGQALMCEARAEKLKAQLGSTALPATQLGGRLDVPSPRRSPDRAAPHGGVLTSRPQLRVPDADDADVVSVEEALSGDDDVVEVGSGDVEPISAEWRAVLESAASTPADEDEATPDAHSTDDDLDRENDPEDEQSLMAGSQGEDETGELPDPSLEEVETRIDDEGRRTAEVQVPLGDPAQPVIPTSAMSAKLALSAERKALFEQVRQKPLDSDGYRLLADHFDTASDPARSSLMLEIANALDGDPNAAPRAPRLILSTTDRAGLRHPTLRGESGELLGLAGLAMVRLFPSRVQVRDDFRLDSGKGARATADALLTAVRILGLRAPDVYLTDEDGPPFALVHTTGPKMLVGRLAVKRELPEAELRFFAGRALFTQNPELLVLRSLRREQLQQGLMVLGQVLRGAISVDAKLMRDVLPVRSLGRLKELYNRVAPRIELQKLAEGARHSANRAGLVVAGGVAPAISSLRAKRALESEMLELVRFAASERYLQMRTRRLGK